MISIIPNIPRIKDRLKNLWIMMTERPKNVIKSIIIIININIVLSNNIYTNNFG